MSNIGIALSKKHLFRSKVLAGDCDDGLNKIIVKLIDDGSITDTDIDILDNHIDGLFDSLRMWLIGSSYPKVKFSYSIDEVRDALKEFVSSLYFIDDKLSTGEYIEV